MKKVVKKTVKKSPKKAAFSVRPRGISKVAIIAIVAVVLVGGGAFFVLGNKGGNGLSSAVPFMKPALNPNCEKNDPELCKFLNNWQVQQNYKVTSSTTVDGMTVESIMELSGEDKFHMVSKQNGKEVSNMISIKDTTYTLDYSDNKWAKFTYTQDKENEDVTKEVKDQFAFDDKETKDTTKYTFVTKEACGDLKCFKYEIADEQLADMKQYIWFDDKDYLMRRTATESKTGEKSDSYFSYDQISITEPSPVKEGNAASAGGMSAEDAKRMMKEYEEQAGSDNASYPDYGSETPVDDGTSADY